MFRSARILVPGVAAVLVTIALTLTTTPTAFAASTPYEVANIWPADGGSRPADMVAVGTSVYFSANDASHGREPYVSNGTSGGTFMLKDIAKGLASSKPLEFTSVAGLVFFTAADKLGRELWVSDGTALGTHLVKDVRTGPYGSAPADLVELGNTLYFAANDGVHGRELWRSDGSADGTVLVRDIVVGSHGVNPISLTAFDGHLYFAARSNASSGCCVLWRSDGTGHGTSRVLDKSGARISQPHDLLASGDYLYFVARDRSNGGSDALWRTEGADSSTRSISAALQATDLTDVSGKLFFASSTPGSTGLWKSDGSKLGTVRVADLPNIDQLTAIGDDLFFTTIDDSGWMHLTVTDGTVGEMHSWSSWNTNNGARARNLTNFGGVLYYIAANQLSYGECDAGGCTTYVWHKEVAFDLPAPANHDHLVAAGGTLFFTATSQDHGNELWAYQP